MISKATATTPSATLEERTSSASGSLAVVVAPVPLPGQSGRVAPGGGAPATSLLDAAKLTVPQAAMRLGIGETKMRLVIQRSGIPVLRIGGKVVVIEQDIERCLQDNYGRLDVPEWKPSERPSLPKSIQESAMLNKAS